MRNSLLFVSLIFVSVVAHGNLGLQLEAGAVWQHRNDVQIPPATGTFLSFDEFNQGPFFHYRFEADYAFNDRHGMRLVLAPFSAAVTGTPDRNVTFNGQTYPSGAPLTVNYTFNSYRLGYFYKLIDGTGDLKIGLTAKLRQAEIKMEGSGLSSSYTNEGFVPLLYLAYDHDLNGGYSFFTDADFSAAPQGRAFDWTVKVRKQIGPSSFVSIGARTIEGGADNDKVITWSWFNYAVVDYRMVF